MYALQSLVYETDKNKKSMQQGLVYERVKNKKVTILLHQSHTDEFQLWHNGQNSPKQKLFGKKDATYSFRGL